MTRSQGDGGFVAFFRWYTSTWVHAVATAALTGLGLLTFVHRYFAAIAVAAYVLPPIALYLGGSSTGPGKRGERSERNSRPPAGNDAQQTPADPPTDADESSGSTAGSRSAWGSAFVPTEEALHDVAMAGDRSYAVGEDGGAFVDTARESDDGAWTTVLPDGPGAQSNALRSVDATRDGGVWFAGDNGDLGRVDPATDRHVDYSTPGDDTTSITGVATALGPDGETVLLADGSGRVRRGRYRDGELAWDEPRTPGSGSSVTGIAMVDESVGYVCDSNQSVFQTSDGGRNFDRIGQDVADGTLTDVAGTADGTCVASADDGVCHRFDGTTWTPIPVGDGALRAIDVRDDHWLACGDGGLVYERGGGESRSEGRGDAATDWRRQVTPAAVPLRGCALGDSRAVAVGDDGTVVERTLPSSATDGPGA